MVADIVEEKKEIIARYRRLLRKAKPVLKEGDARRIKRAFQLALDAHHDSDITLCRNPRKNTFESIASISKAIKFADGFLI